MGDLVVMDFEGKVGGKPFEGGKGEDMSVELGSGRLIPGFEDQLVGAKAGDEPRSEGHLPGRLSGRPISPGKDATFAVTVKAVKTAGETKVDEEFAKSLGLQSLDQLQGPDPRPADAGAQRPHPHAHEAPAARPARRAARFPGARDRWSRPSIRTSSASCGTRRATKRIPMPRWPRSRRMPPSIAASPSAACGSACCCRKSAPPTASRSPSRR